MTNNELRMLTDDERLDALDAARQVVIRKYGQRPQRDHYRHTKIGRYPGWFTRLIALVMLVVFVAAAMPSLFRLFTAGRDYFKIGIDSAPQAAVVGVSTFLLAEFLIILSTISARVYFTGRARWMFLIPITLGLAMALVGNWVIAQPHDLFGWLETVSPPVAVLFLALIGERLVLDAIEERHANERAFQEALADWTAQTREPQQSLHWHAAYANALRAALIRANSTGRGATERRAVMSQMTSAEWVPLVQRELHAERWFTVAAPQEDAPNPIQAPPPLTVNQHPNGSGAAVTRSGN